MSETKSGDGGMLAAVADVIERRVRYLRFACEEATLREEIAKSREHGEESAGFEHGLRMAMGFEIERLEGLYLLATGRALVDPTLTPIPTSPDADLVVKEMARESAIEAIALDNLHGRQLED